MKKIIHTQPAWARRVVYLQVAVQAAMALTPFYAVTVGAATASTSDERLLNGSAQHASAFGQAVQSGSLSAYASQHASGMASQAMQQWLSNVGTARVELGADNRFTPRSGAVDLLLPLYKNHDRLLFTQSGLRNVDGQFTGNIGFGQRHFTSDWMLGYNAFYDQNISRGHKRIGSGIEAWRDYLKLSGNGYYRLSNWRDSRDVEDYDARPANGFDLRAEAWLPAYAAIGGRLMYEKYYGNEVALFGTDKRQKNPGAVTAGLSYTPVPLISFTADHKRGGSQNDTRFGLQMTYQLGQSLASHLDASAVNLKRTLAGSGMDLVERNNNIVLDYQKRQLIDLSLPKEIIGISGKTVPVNYQLTSKYGLAKIVWNDAAISAAGGKMQDLGGGKYQLVLPAYTAGAINSWPLSGVAYDGRNNPSKVATTTVTVTRPAVSAENSTVTASPEILIADGAATSVISITLNDETGAPVTGLAADISAALKEELANAPVSKVKTKTAIAKPASLGEVQEQDNGVYTLTLTAGTRPMLAVISPALGALALSAVTVNQISDVASAIIRDGDLKLVADGAMANASASNSVQARVTDATGNPVAGVAVTFTLSGAAQVAAGSSLTSVSDANGNASVNFINMVAETVTITATTATGGSAKVNATFIADRSTAALAESDLTVDRSSAVANGRDKITYSAMVKDANGNPLPDVRVNWSADGGSLNGASSVTGSDGKATITLSNTVAENVQTAAALEGGTSVNAPLVGFTADAASGGIGQNDLTVSKNSAVADGSDGITYTVLVKDANGNPLKDQTVNWQTTLGNLSAASSVTDASGQATIHLTSLQAAQAQVSVGLTGQPALNAPLVSFTADAASGSISQHELTVNKISATANGSDGITYKAIVKDANGNPLTGQTVNWQTTLGNLSAAASVTDANGQATIILTSLQAAQAQVSASLTGKPPVNAPLVSFTADAASGGIGQNDLTVNKNSAIADGSDGITYKAIVKDANGNPLTGQTVNWQTTLGNLSAAASVTDANGQATIILTSLQASQAQVSARLTGKPAVNAPQVSFIADATSGAIAQNDLTVNKNSAIADGSDGITYKANVKDANGNPLAGQTVNWQTTLGDLSATSSITDANGQATINLTSLQAAQAQVSASLTGKPAVNAPLVSFIADATSGAIGQSDLTANKNSAVADGSDGITYTAIVKDANGNPLAGQTVNWQTTLGDLSAASSVTDVNGRAIVILTSLQAEQAQVSAGLTGQPAVNAPLVSFIADAASAQIGSGDLTVDKTVIVGNNVDAATFTAVVKDAKGNPVANHSVSWGSDRGNLNAASTSTNNKGETTVRLTGTLAGIAQVTASVNGNAAVNAPQVTVTADSSSAQIGSGDLIADKTSALANGTEAVTYTATVKDASGNLVSGLAISWGTDLGNLGAPTSTTGTDGKATITLTSTQAGNAIVNAKPGSGSAASASPVTFIADGSTANIGSGDLNVDKTTVVANNTDKATYTALVKDANGNPLANHSVSWSTSKGTLSGAMSVTNRDGYAVIELRNTKAELATVTAMVRTVTRDADAVTFIADVTTAKVDVVVSDRTKITGTGTETATLTATVSDANDNLLINYPVTWTTTRGSITPSSMTGVNGQAISEQSGVSLTGTSNETLTITASTAIAGNQKTVGVGIRALLSTNGKLYWTMKSDYPTKDEATAAKYCNLHGGGRLLTRADVADFGPTGGDFASMAVAGEFANITYGLAGEWDYSADISSINGFHGIFLAKPETYACVK
ncbi:Ig-like domain-containing protein [Pantoea sp. S18]|uniref:Ig-like domain-containing protein n=1 Tax=Pantoea sp. S18 TaxID=3019892 RepID=UPI002B1F0998|nr:Ig-like domain-containing protein [Pantoea sp. S18]MEA5101172.1 Ig-like domain-containing protein [Pantoea sp. S18]